MSGTAEHTADEGGAAPPPDISPEVEARARNMGWTSREQFKGDPERWVDAGTFVERGERMLPLLQERNRALDRTVTDLKGQMGQQQQMLSDLVSRTRRAEKIGYERAMRELQQKRAEAVSQGDTEAFNRVEQEIQSMGPAPEPPPEAPARANGAAAPNGAPTDVNPVVVAWVRRNPWFNRDPIANAAAVAALSQVEKENPGDSLEEHLVEVEQRIAQHFPQHFQRRSRNGADGEEARRAAPSVLASSSAQERRPGPRSFDAIPAEHKREYERQRKMLDGKGEAFSKDEFARYYWEAEGEA